MALQAQQAQTVTALCRGEFVAAVRNMEHGALLYDPQQHRGHSVLFGQDPDVACRAFGAVALWLLGFPEQALRMSDDAVARSRELRHPSSQALALHFAAMLHQLRRDAGRVSACSEASGAIAGEHGLSFWAAGAAVLRGWALAEQGDGEGISMLQKGLADWQATGSVTYQTYYLGLLAETLGKRRDVAEAQRVVDEALALTQRTGEGLYLAELHRLHGELLLASAAREQLSRAQIDCVDKDFRTAIEVADRQEAKALKLRAAISLARLHQGRSNAVESHSLLEQTYLGFSEGLETPDLKEVRQFLEQSTFQ
jgi:adenylate cyclase